MDFAVGEKELFENVGFNTESWRHSTDEKRVLVHKEFAETLLGDLEKYPDIQTYTHNDEAFQTLLDEDFAES